MLTGLAPVTSYKPITQFTGNHWQRPAAIFSRTLKQRIETRRDNCRFIHTTVITPELQLIAEIVKDFLHYRPTVYEDQGGDQNDLARSITADWDLPNITTIPSFDTCSTGPSFTENQLLVIK